MTPSQRSPRSPKFSKTISKKFKSLDFQLHLPRSLSTHSRRIIQSNISFYHAPAAPNEITNNSRSRHNQRAITSERGHTNVESAFTSEGAKALTKSFSPQLVPRRLLRHGHFPHGHLPRESPLVPAAPGQCSRSPHHQKKMKYMALMKGLCLQPLWKRGFGNEVGRPF
jgi:hypothetical protein